MQMNSSVDCIPYINDLNLEIKMLIDIKNNGNCDIESITEKINQKKELVERCKSNLEKLSTNQICYRLYLNMLNGLTPSKAVEKVATENYMQDITPTDPEWIWTKYYKKVKKIIEPK